MTPEQIKEHLSRHFIGLVASRRGFKSDVIETDHGADLSITRATFRDRPQGPRLTDTGTALHVQLKCTCAVSTSHDGDAFKYKLNVVTYNDLVERRQAGRMIKLMLILLVLPDDESTWLQVTPDELVMRRAAYWYYPDLTEQICTNDSSKTIRIPYANAVGMNLFPEKFLEFYEEG